MNWAVSHLANRKEFHRTVGKVFKGQEGAEKKEIISKESIVLGTVTL